MTADAAPGKTPFERVLVPIDGSEPSRAALRFGLKLAAQGAVLVLVHAFEARAEHLPLDSRALADAFERRAHALLDEAVRFCRSQSIEPVFEFARDRPVSAILEVARGEACDLVILGTHARPTIPQAFLGSTAVGVLRLSEIPVLTIRTATSEKSRLFGTALVAVDDSEPSDAAVLCAARLKKAVGTELVICSAVDPFPVFQGSADAGLDPTAILEDMKAAARSTVENALDKASLSISDGALEVVEGEPVHAILEAAERCNADLIVMGSHGRRGMRRFFLGSVAERVVRRSPVPVLVVRAPHERR